MGMPENYTHCVYCREWHDRGYNCRLLKNRGAKPMNKQEKIKEVEKIIANNTFTLTYDQIVKVATAIVDSMSIDTISVLSKLCEHFPENKDFKPYGKKVFDVAKAITPDIITIKGE